jgi:hypothetical protein|tara:strand:+ start:3286 stop:4659 length:1374 start_codon:yes stop_codon:yes gene_type:complete
MSNITAVPYFYDKQFRRYIQQFIRLFSGFQYVKGYTDQGEPVYHTTPVRYGDISRMAAHIMRENSENTMSTVPFVSCYVTDLQPDVKNRVYPQFEEKMSVIEKAYNSETLSYENRQGSVYTVERHMPVPYTLRMQADIWTSNTEQKMQLMEQILVLFNPSLNIHTTNNPLDWSSLSVVELLNTQWTNRSIPQGTDDIIDISSLQFEMPILINPPAKVSKNSMIHTIINNLHEVATGDADSIKVLSDINAITTSYTVTAPNNKVKLSITDGGAATAQILGHNGAVEAGLTWETLFKQYGAELRPNVSQIRFKQTDDPGDMTTDIIGTISGDVTTTTLNVTIDINTVPGDTQPAVDTVIDPQINYPGDGTLTAATNGDRYLVLDEVPSGGAWGTISANKNDIISYNGTTWSVSFDASSNAAYTHYTTNTTTMDKLKWNGVQWVNAYEGTYNSGFWRVYL